MNYPKVRLASPDDIGAIKTIYAPYVVLGTASFEVEEPDTEEFLRRRAGILDLGLPYLVATIDEQVVGYAYASRFRPRAAYRFTVENSVYVAEQFQRRGVARELMKQVITESANLGMREMIAVIGDPAVNSASVALHHSLGFAEVGVFRGIGEKFGRSLDVMMMQKTLTNSSLPTIP